MGRHTTPPAARTRRPSVVAALAGAAVVPLLGFGIVPAFAGTTSADTASEAQSLLGLGPLDVDLDACVDLDLALNAAQEALDAAPADPDLLSAVADLQAQIGDAGCHDDGGQTTTTTPPTSTTPTTTLPPLGGPLGGNSGDSGDSDGGGSGSGSGSSGSGGSGSGGSTSVDVPASSSAHRAPSNQGNSDGHLTPDEYPRGGVATGGDGVY